ncbi:hypothetical protein LX36DRAFT_685338 [Colletotrichum falcatum]|nr:hypothetical protein LX36DRAFT_685338 [Colletotrichum falcatum]
MPTLLVFRVYLQRGLRFVLLNLETAKLFVFVDRSFANNADLTFNDSIEQSTKNTGEFTVNRNIVHFSSTKCKQVTRSVLASEIYTIVAGADIVYRLAIPPIPTVIYTDLYLLYECLVKLGTTKEKRLIIDIIAIRYDNPADSFTKSSPNIAGVFTLFDGAFYHKRKLPVLRYQSPGDIGRYADVSAAEAWMFRR